MYLYKVELFVSEIVYVFLTPFILIFTLPKCSEKILDFVKDVTVCVDGVGDVVGYSTYDFKNFSNDDVTND